ncbi:MAG: Lrp/AsnC ligand binding domain-containing protein [Candidatus Nanoarchaeia archaeon]|nr:Lrp/AsnC ligand binding domain-containing protein [Candidatus Haiyanarchaeum thermophilum]MCW1303214.1 Lrp/AsnC ligand binding domain-containing protein [Candidatus Haiyanarchaeum thermophilum]MCW1304054.1 Lrp/AsnC ligand binding domain-containing protein [Candidatus Haiyanarchaeum thermophilum]MCW1306793.1 Lrp/AsnC ligand binding domain-containing protein [Candidatus Haiyanarchaeum thermophilum]MCW1307462.1 Lrp/AsnC ligand binding domain-containing protein [Candidatus Haiyanarchaeum thermop
MEVALSEGRIETLYRRLKEYEKLGFFATEEGKILALVHVFTRENIEKGEELEKIAEEVAKLEEVEEVDILTGEWDLLVRVKVDNLRELAHFVVNKLRRISGVEKTITSIVLRRISK